MQTPNFTTPEEACAILGVHYITILKHLHTGYIKSKKYGRCYLIPNEEIRDFIKLGKKRAPGRPRERRA